MLQVMFGRSLRDEMVGWASTPYASASCCFLSQPQKVTAINYGRDFSRVALSALQALIKLHKRAADDLRV